MCERPVQQVGQGTHGTMYGKGVIERTGNARPIQRQNREEGNILKNAQQIEAF